MEIVIYSREKSYENICFIYIYIYNTYVGGKRGNDRMKLFERLKFSRSTFSS